MDNDRIFQTAALLGGLSVPLFPAVAAVAELAGNIWLMGLIGFAGLEFLIIAIFIAATLLEFDERVTLDTMAKTLVQAPGFVLWGLVSLAVAQVIQVRILLFS